MVCRRVTFLTVILLRVFVLIKILHHHQKHILYSKKAWKWQHLSVERFSVTGPRGPGNVETKIKSRKTEKSYRKTCCSLQKNCNLGDDLFFSRTITPNMKSKRRSDGFKITMAGQDESRICGRTLKWLFAHSPYEAWQRLSSFVKIWEKCNVQMLKAEADITTQPLPGVLLIQADFSWTLTMWGFKAAK